MNITRLGTVFILAGLGLLLSTLNSRPPESISVSYEILGANETQCYVIVAPPVGESLMTVGEMELNESFPVHVKLLAPDGGVLINQSVAAPSSFAVYFDRRGEYTVCVTNEGSEESIIPVRVRFEKGFANVEKDKLLISEISVVLGAALILLGVLTKYLRKS